MFPRERERVLEEILHMPMADLLEENNYHYPFHPK